MPDITGQLENPQEIEIFVSGPEDANRLYLCNGLAQVGQGAYNNANGLRQTYTFRIGPTLTRQQMVRATASVAMATTHVWEYDGVSGFSLSLDNVEADWDDEAQQVEVRFDVQATAENLSVFLGKVSYQVNILAALPPQ